MAVNFQAQLMNICDDALAENLLYSNLPSYHEKELYEKIADTVKY